MKPRGRKIREREHPERNSFVTRDALLRVTFVSNVTALNRIGYRAERSSIGAVHLSIHPVSLHLILCKTPIVGISAVPEFEQLARSVKL